VKVKVLRILASLALFISLVAVFVPTTPVSAAALSGNWNVTSVVGSGTYNQGANPVLEGGSVTFNCSMTGSFTGSFGAVLPLQPPSDWSMAMSIVAGGSGSLETHTAAVFVQPMVFRATYNWSYNPALVDYVFGRYNSYWWSSIVTTDGSNIAALFTLLGGMHLDLLFTPTDPGTPTIGTWTVVGFSGGGSWSGNSYPLASAPYHESVSGGTPGTAQLPGVAELRYDISAPGNIYLAEYAVNPGGTLPAQPLKYVEVCSDINRYYLGGEYYRPQELRIYYTDAEVEAAGISESTLRMYSWDGFSWVQSIDTGVNTGANYVYANLNHFSPYSIMGSAGGGGGGGGGGASGVPVFPSLYIGLAAAFGACIVAYLMRRRLAH